MLHEIEMYGLRRSGLHAIAAWMLHRCGGGMIRSINHNVCRSFPAYDKANEQIGDGPHTALVYEDREPDVVPDRSGLRYTEAGLARPDQRHYVYVLRSYETWAASRIKKKEIIPNANTAWKGPKTTEKWVRWALFCRSQIPGITVLYDLWCTDEKYRRHLETIWRFPHNGPEYDDIMTYVPKAGGGSSFAPGIREVVQVDRFAEVSHLPEWQDVLANKTALDISRSIFNADFRPYTRSY
jgi:hypothetical protein